MRGRSSGPPSGTRWVNCFTNMIQCWLYVKGNYFVITQYQLEKPANDEDYEDEDEAI